MEQQNYYLLMATDTIKFFGNEDHRGEECAISLFKTMEEAQNYLINEVKDPAYLTFEWIGEDDEDDYIVFKIYDKNEHYVFGLLNEYCAGHIEKIELTR